MPPQPLNPSTHRTPENNGSGTDTLIIGGGLIGLSLAWELAGRGQQVTVLESRTCGSASSWAGVGILPPVAQHHLDDPLEQLRALSHNLLADWSGQFERLTNIDTGYRRCGGIYVATTVGEAATLAANCAYWGELGIDVRPLSPTELAADQPALTPLAQSGRIRAAVHLPVSASCALHTTSKRCWPLADNAEFVIHESTEVIELTQTPNSVSSVRARQGTNELIFQATNYCLSAGP